MTNEQKIAIALGVLFLFFGGAAAVVQYTQRGLRNNNPGNIVHGDDWVGLADEQTDPTFATFATPEYGIRAMATILKNYQSRYGINTVDALVRRWSTTDQDAYIENLSDALGVQPKQVISIAGALPVLIPAMIRQENGLNPYSDTTILTGIRMAA